MCVGGVCGGMCVCIQPLLNSFLLREEVPQCYGASCVCAVPFG